MHTYIYILNLELQECHEMNKKKIFFLSLNYSYMMLTIVTCNCLKFVLESFK